MPHLVRAVAQRAFARALAQPIPRGLVRVQASAETDPSVVLGALKASVDNVTGDVKKRMSSIEKDIDGLSEAIAAMRVNGVGAQSGREDPRLRNERKALGVYARTQDMSEIKALMTSDSGPDGGYLVDSVMSKNMITRLFDLTPMRRLARIETITTGDAFVEPIDFDDVGAEWVGEKQQRPATKTPQIGELRVPLDELYSLQPVSQRLLDDSGFDVGGYIERKVTDRFARSEGLATIVGDGVKKPRGVLSYPTAATPDLDRPVGTLQHVPSGSGEIAADALRDLTWSLRGPYRRGASWLMSSNTASQIDKLKDGQGNYLWRDGMTAGAPPSLLGYPVEFSEDMPDVTLNACPIAFGNWKLGYVLVDRPGVKWLLDPYSAKPLVQMYGYRRVGGAVAHFDAIKLLKIAAT